MLLPLDYKKLPVEVLIALMADKTQEQRFLDRAFSEFHSRYADYGFKIAVETIATKSILDESELLIIVHNSLLSIYFKAHVFTPAPEGIPEKQKHKRICGWIAVITRNAATRYMLNQDKIKKRIILTESIDDYADIVNAIEDTDEDISPPSPERLLLEAGIAKISERDWHITSTYLSWEDEYGNIPSEILARINERYNLLPKYAGKITNRTIDKLFLINPILQIETDHGPKTAKSRRETIRREIKRLPPRDGQDVPGDTGTG